MKEKIFSNSVEYKDGIATPRIDYMANDEAVEASEEIRDAIFDAMLAGKLDKTDIAIIHARDCSPMPSMRQVSRILKIPESTIRLRVAHIISLMPKSLQIKIT